MPVMPQQLIISGHDFIFSDDRTTLTCRDCGAFWPTNFDGEPQTADGTPPSPCTHDRNARHGINGERICRDRKCFEKLYELIPEAFPRVYINEAHDEPCEHMKMTDNCNCDSCTDWNGEEE